MNKALKIFESLFESLVEKVFMLDRWKLRFGHKCKSGEVAKSLSNEDRQELIKLTSEDLNQMQILGAPYWCDKYYTDKKINF